MYILYLCMYYQTMHVYILHTECELIYIRTMYIFTSTHINTQIYVYIYMHTHAHTHTRTHAHTHTHTHTHARARLQCALTNSSGIQGRETFIIASLQTLLPHRMLAQRFKRGKYTSVLLEEKATSNLL